MVKGEYCSIYFASVRIVLEPMTGLNIKTQIGELQHESICPTRMRPIYPLAVDTEFNSEH